MEPNNVIVCTIIYGVVTIIYDVLPIKDTILTQKSVNIIEGPLPLHSISIQIQVNFNCSGSNYLCVFRLIFEWYGIESLFFFIFLLFSFYLFPSHLNLLGKCN
jgi:hypothetical protein